MMVNIPAQVAAQRLCNRCGRMAPVHGRVMLKTVLANHMHQGWQLGNLHHRASPERIQRVVGELALPHIRADSPRQVIGTHAAESQRPRSSPAFQRPKSVLFAQRGAEALVDAQRDEPGRR